MFCNLDLFFLSSSNAEIATPLAKAKEKSERENIKARAKEQSVSKVLQG